MMGQLPLLPLDENARQVLEKSKDQAHSGKCDLDLSDFRFLYQYADAVEVEPGLTLNRVLQGCRMMMCDATVPERVIDEMLELP